MGGDLDRLLRQDSPPPRHNSSPTKRQPRAGGLSSLLNHTDVSLYQSVPVSSAKHGRSVALKAHSQSHSAPLASEHRPGSRTESSPEASLGDPLGNPAIFSIPSWTAINRLAPILDVNRTEHERPRSSGSQQQEAVHGRQTSSNATAQHRRHSPPRAEAGPGPRSTAASVEVGHRRAVTAPGPITITRQDHSASTNSQSPDKFKRALKPELPSFKPQQHAFASTALSQASGPAVRDDHITTPPSPAPSPEIGSVIASPISAAISGLERPSAVPNLGCDSDRTTSLFPVPRASVNSTVGPQSTTNSHSRRRARSVRFAEQSADHEMATSPNIDFLTAHAGGSRAQQHSTMVVPHQAPSSSRPPVPRPFDEMTSAGTPVSAPEISHGRENGNPQRPLTELQFNAVTEQKGQELPGVFTSCSQCGESWTSPARFLPAPTEISQLHSRLAENTKARAELVEAWHANHQCPQQSAVTRRTASSLSPPAVQDFVSQTGKRKEQADPIVEQMSPKMHRVSVDSPSPHACQPSPPPEPSVDDDDGYVTVWFKSPEQDDTAKAYPVRMSKHVASLFGAVVGAPVPQVKVKEDWTSMYQLHDTLEGRKKTSGKSSQDAVMTDFDNDIEGV